MFSANNNNMVNFLRGCFVNTADGMPGDSCCSGNQTMLETAES